VCIFSLVNCGQFVFRLVLLCIFSWLIRNSAVSCLIRLVSAVTYYMLSGTLNSQHCEWQHFDTVCLFHCIMCLILHCVSAKNVTLLFLLRVGIADGCISHGRVCLSVCPSSVTRWYCVETNEATIMWFSPTGRTIILDSGEVKIVLKFAGDHP